MSARQHQVVVTIPWKQSANNTVNIDDNGVVVLSRRSFVAIPSQKALLMCPYVPSCKFLVLAPRCSRAPLHNLQRTSDRCLIFASHLATRIIPAIAIISRLLCLQGTRRSFKYFPKNALLSFCRNMKFAVHVPCAGWLILPCSALARTHDFKNFLLSIQVFCCKTVTMLWYDSSYRCLCEQSSMSTPWHHFSYRRLSVLICIQTPASRHGSLRVFGSSLAPLFAYLRIWDSLIRKNVGCRFIS